MSRPGSILPIAGAANVRSILALLKLLERFRGRYPPVAAKMSAAWVYRQVVWRRRLSTINLMLKQEPGNVMETGGNTTKGMLDGPGHIELCD